jgi:hypothetical protein
VRELARKEPALEACGGTRRERDKSGKRECELMLYTYIYINDNTPASCTQLRPPRLLLPTTRRCSHRRRCLSRRHRRQGGGRNRRSRCSSTLRWAGICITHTRARANDLCGINKCLYGKCNKNIMSDLRWKRDIEKGKGE